jgi:hypothetical protein
VHGGDWTRFNYDAQRSGVGPANTGITAANVGRLRVRTVHIDGAADSSAVELHAVRIGGRSRDVIVVTTTFGRTIAIDPGTGAHLWEYVPRDIGSYEGSTQITTATPVADPSRRYVYAASPDGRIHKLLVASGREVISGGWPAVVTYDAGREKIAGALNLVGGAVIVVTGGYYGDAPSYQGHLVMLDRVTGRRLQVFNTLCSNRHVLIVPRSCGASDSAIWARAGAVVERDTGRLLVATGNGPFNGSTNWGESVLELTPNAGRLLQNWTPRNQADLSASDSDIGSTGPAVLPVVSGRRLAIQGGKDGWLRLLDLDRLDGTTGGAGPRLGGELGQMQTPGGSELFTQPAVWRSGSQTYVFVADNSGTAAYVVGGGTRPRLSVAWHTDTPGTSPVIAGGLLYIYDHVDGRLEVIQPKSGHTIAALPAAPGHWNSPIVVGGRIVLPVGGSTRNDARSGVVEVYHLVGR